MAYALSPELDRIVQEKMSTGRYSTEEDVLREALRLLTEQEEVVIAVAEGHEDIRRGRCRPFDEADAEFRHEHGISQSG